MNKTTSVLHGKQLLCVAIDKALEKKADKNVILELQLSTYIADWIYICESDNPIQNRAIAENIIIGLKQQGTPPWHVEGLEEGRWILIDYSDVVVHVMLPEIREYYQLETLWEESSRVSLREFGIDPESDS
ncbi:MAG: ribosome silencing factor [Fibrobacterota bacterium]